MELFRLLREVKILKFLLLLDDEVVVRVMADDDDEVVWFQIHHIL